MNRLEINSVSLNYGAVKAVSELDLCVGPGELCGLIGPNGSGKSSLLNVINGFVSPSAGSIVLDDSDVTKQPSHVLARRGVSRTFQLIRLLKGLSVRENTLAGSDLLRYRQTGTDAAVGRAELVELAMERCGVLEFAESHVEELPFGIQRRVELARAVVAEPTLLLLDEPAAGLSPGDLEDLATIIRAEAARGAAVILVDHHLHFVVDVCSRLVVLNFGNKIFDGSSEAAVADPKVREAYVGA